MQFTTNGMKHTPAQVMVLQSNDYDKFQMIKGNRDLDMNKIKKILSDIDRGTNLLRYCPIICIERDGQLHIVDGQHRFVVAKKIKDPVHYIIGTELSLYDIARMNSNTEKWKAGDFINCYKELGNENYIALENFLNDFPGMNITTAISLLAKGKILMSQHTAYMDKFHRGEFKVEHEAVARKIAMLIKAFDYKNKFSKPFMTACEKVMVSGVYSVQELARKVNENKDMMGTHDHWRKYLTNMEEIASKGKQKRVAIY